MRARVKNKDKTARHLHVKTDHVIRVVFLKIYFNFPHSKLLLNLIRANFQYQISERDQTADTRHPFPDNAKHTLSYLLHPGGSLVLVPSAFPHKKPWFSHTGSIFFFFFNPLQFYSPISLRARSAFKVQPADHVIRKLEALCFRRLRNQSFGCGRNSSEGNLSSCSTSTLAQCWLLLHRPLVNPHIDMDVDNLHGCPSVRERERARQRPGLHYS